MTDYNLELTERMTIRLPKGEKIRLFALSQVLHTNASGILRMLMNTTTTLDELLKKSGINEEDILKLIAK